MNEDLKKRLKEFYNTFLGIIGIIFFIYVGFGLTKEFFRDDFEKVNWSGSSITVVECLYPFGSLFNRNELSLDYTYFIIKEHDDRKLLFPIGKPI
ncbi:MAG: hypothetical protein NUV74_13365 [Candidatus Brocadiaceae bacterium]|nr:hypothetical protein [Candidatus Brocadiaceae bacterium]